MPLEFQSINHRKIAFGFFNIETDMILLNQYFLFAEDFCGYIDQATEKNDEFSKASSEGYRIEEKDIGNLMRAIYGVEFRVFIGEVYQLFPSPQKREEFKQKPEGFKNRVIIEELIQKYGKRVSIPFVINQKDDQVSIGEYVLKLSPARRSFDLVLTPPLSPCLPAGRHRGEGRGEEMDSYSGV